LPVPTAVLPSCPARAAREGFESEEVHTGVQTGRENQWTAGRNSRQAGNRFEGGLSQRKKVYVL